MAERSAVVWNLPSFERSLSKKIPIGWVFNSPQRDFLDGLAKFFIQYMRVNGDD